MNLERSLLVSVVILAGGLSASASAADVLRVREANASASCQAFTPGPTNTIRNRVIGAENVGPPMNVACSFEKTHTSDKSAYSHDVDMFFSNASTAPVTINCTLGATSTIPGVVYSALGLTLNKSLSLEPGTQGYIRFTPQDTVDPIDTDFGADVVGVNCKLPTNAVINATKLYWREEVGETDPSLPSIP